MENENTASVTLKPGTIVHICGWPVELRDETVVCGSRGNIELVTRDLYLRASSPLATPAAQG